MKKKILLIILGILVILQFFGIDKTNPDFDKNKDFLAMHNPPDKIRSMIKSACYDCHSYETVYPWYTSISPLSWWINNHIQKGREDLNFSLWGDYNADKKSHMLEECVEYVSENKMPLKSYTYTHPDAVLSDEDKSLLQTYFRSLR